MNPASLDLTAPSALIFAICVAIVDLRTHCIPNVLVLTGAVLAFAMGAEAAGASGVVECVSGMLTGLALFLPLYVMRGMSAGDVKAMAATGAFLGLEGTVLAAALTLLVGALIAVTLLIAHRESAAIGALKHRLFALFGALPAGFRAGTQPPAAHSVGPDRRFPYGIAIAVGTVIALVWLDRLPATPYLETMGMY